MFFNEKLLKAKAEYDELSKKHEGYHKKSMPKVLEYLKEYKKTGKYPYNADVARFILETEKIDENLHDYLDTEVYLAQKDLGEEIKQEIKTKMLSDGYLELTRDVEYRGKIELVAKYTNDWMANKIAQTCKIITSGDGYPFIVAKGKRSRGWYIHDLENAFYKPVA